MPKIDRENVKVLVATAVIVLAMVMATSFMVSTFGWLFAGHVVFGWTVGLLIGVALQKVKIDLPLGKPRDG